MPRDRADDNAPDIPGDDSHILYYDDTLDDAHDDSGTLDDNTFEDATDWNRLYAERPSLPVRLWQHAHWVVYAGAFLTPLIVIGGLLLALNALDGGEDSANPAAPTVTDTAPPPTATAVIAAEWPADVTFAAHTTPARIRNRFNTPGARHGYAFEGEAGDAWQIAVEPYQGSATDPRITLYGPDGVQRCAGGVCADHIAQSSLTIALDTSGTYRLVVDSASGTATGLYLLTLDVE